MSDLTTAREALEKIVAGDIEVPDDELGTILAPMLWEDAADIARQALATLNTTSAVASAEEARWTTDQIRAAIEELAPRHLGIADTRAAVFATYVNRLLLSALSVSPPPAVLGEENQGLSSVGMKPSREGDTGGGAYQARVGAWMHACFGDDITNDRTERAYRFLEEALELIQALGCTREEAIRLVDYTFARPVGELPQEVGGVMVTLAALCVATGEDLDGCAEAELARVWTKIDKIRAKHAAKPKDVRSSLPGYAASVAPEARASAQPNLSAEGAHEGCEATEKPTEPATAPLSAIEGWRDMATAPNDGTEFLATVRVFSRVDGKLLYHDTHIIAVDDETGDIAIGYEQGWSLTDYEFWRPLPAPPAQAETEGGAS